MYDLIEKYKDNILQHGKNSDRIYLLKYNSQNDEELIAYLESLAGEKGYGKILAKIPEKDGKAFVRHNYLAEGEIPGFYQGREDCIFFVKYLDQCRRPIGDVSVKEIVLEAEKKQVKMPPPLNKDFSIRLLNETDAEEMTGIFKKVFLSYPFPIYEADYLKEMMQSACVYFGVIKEEKIIGISSSEVDWHNKNVEMTDFAILPEYRGYKLAKHLLCRMEDEMTKKGILTFYTIARAKSYPMNATFSSLGYSYGGTLYNNTQISGHIESMNLWYKKAENSSL